MDDTGKAWVQALFGEPEPEPDMAALFKEAFADDTVDYRIWNKLASGSTWHRAWNSASGNPRAAYYSWREQHRTRVLNEVARR